MITQIYLGRDVIVAVMMYVDLLQVVHIEYPDQNTRTTHTSSYAIGALPNDQKNTSQSVSSFLSVQSFLSSFAENRNENRNNINKSVIKTMVVNLCVAN